MIPAVILIVLFWIILVIASKEASKGKKADNFLLGVCALVVIFGLGFVLYKALPAEGVKVNIPPQYQHLHKERPYYQQRYDKIRRERANEKLDN